MEDGKGEKGRRGRNVKRKGKMEEKRKKDYRKVVDALKEREKERKAIGGRSLNRKIDMEGGRKGKRGRRKLK